MEFDKAACKTEGSLSVPNSWFWVSLERTELAGEHNAIPLEALQHPLLQAQVRHLQTKLPCCSSSRYAAQWVLHILGHGIMLGFIV